MEVAFISLGGVMRGDGRHYTRVDIRLRCLVSVAGAQKNRKTPAMTRNLSRSGMLIDWDASVPAALLPGVGDSVSVEIELPAVPNFPRKCLHCLGAIVRIEPGTEGSHSAGIAISRMEFRPLRKPSESSDEEEDAQGESPYLVM